MTRVKGGTVTHQHHKKILKLNKGNFGSRHRLFKRANETMLKALWYSYRDRRVRRRDLPYERHALQQIHLCLKESEYSA
jgi:large subunit ribosomal protein L20